MAVAHGSEGLKSSKSDPTIPYSLFKSKITHGDTHRTKDLRLYSNLSEMTHTDTHRGETLCTYYVS